MHDAAAITGIMNFMFGGIKSETIAAPNQ